MIRSFLLPSTHRPAREAMSCRAARNGPITPHPHHEPSRAITTISEWRAMNRVYPPPVTT
ncbi:hypothetical protein BDY17DRAFT_296667 [Neohortaea acidophila]|uniref:Uncharacterized protein n=1 Tax=Neohortaea acidophila TaxID=245834 RepID=A0A6A6PTE1_9PEZI|nr:uncharacterized protein BDY17DRAFT_296667 [Neohortaea acidophila]KAF2483036.1 hypothetical protein BDY17DRAFT_296667 [Neohortaea acidophila]